jgi:protein required for attachment to host cells
MHMDSVHIPTAALVVISDGRRARFLRNKGTARNPELILERDLECENAPELIAATLYEMGHARKFHELVMVAPRRLLGDLRSRLHPEIEDTLIAEVPKDLAGQPIPELGRLLV